MAGIGTFNRSANLLAGPGTHYSLDGSGTIPSGTRVTIVWQEGDWYYIETTTPYKRRNYIHKSHVIVNSGSFPTIPGNLLTRCVGTAATSRRGPGTTYATAAYLPKGKEVLYVNGTKDGDYALLEYASESGYRARVWYEHMKILGAYGGSSRYRYLSGTYNGLDLGIMRVPAQNIGMASLSWSNYLSNTSYYGINGGFWANKPGEQRTLNISVKNGSNTCAGADTNRVGKGTIYWNGNSLNYKIASTKSEISGISSSGTWAQGGISMFLGNSNWKSRTNSEEGNGYNPDQAYGWGRTAIVANIPEKIVYLIVTNTTTVTMTSIRKAIQDFVGITDGSTDNSSYKGLFLDASGSSQLRAINCNGTVENKPGDSRTLLQIITV